MSWPNSYPWIIYYRDVITHESRPPTFTAHARKVTADGRVLPKCYGFKRLTSEHPFK